MGKTGARWRNRASLGDRLMKYVIEEPNTGCWVFLGSRNKYGYGQLVIWDSAKQKKSVMTAHRLAYEAWRGSVPPGLHVCHVCDLRCCINPVHLFTGTNRDNVQDMLRKGRANKSVGADHGLSRFTPELILAVRSLLNRGVLQREIAEQFGIAQSHVSRIKLGKTWRHLLNG